jgi:hypothetical protein
VTDCDINLEASGVEILDYLIKKRASDHGLVVSYNAV